MDRERSMRWIATTGMLLMAAGAGFIADRTRPFVTLGDGFCLAGALCFLVPGWLHFGRKCGAWLSETDGGDRT